MSCMHALMAGCVLPTRASSEVKRASSEDRQGEPSWLFAGAVVLAPLGSWVSGVITGGQVLPVEAGIDLGSGEVGMPQ